MGFDFIYDFLGWFNIYGEFAYQNRRNFACVGGISHQFSDPFRGAIGIEYMADKKNQEDYLCANFNIISQKTDLFLVSGYDLNNKGYFLMPMISFFPIEKVEFLLSGKIISLKNKSPDESDIRVLGGKISYHF